MWQEKIRIDKTFRGKMICNVINDLLIWSMLRHYTCHASYFVNFYTWAENVNYT